MTTQRQINEAIEEALAKFPKDEKYDVDSVVFERKAFIKKLEVRRDRIRPTITIPFLTIVVGDTEFEVQITGEEADALSSRFRSGELPMCRLVLVEDPE